MTSIPITDRTRAEDAENCDCGCVCCGTSDVNSVSADTKPTENAADESGCGCGCGG